MSDSESTPPGDGEPPSPPPPPPPVPPVPASADATPAADDGPADGPPLIVPATPEPVIESTVESTTQMPTLPPTAAMRPPDAGGPGGPGYPYEYDPVEPYDPAHGPAPWWKQPAGIAAITFALLLIAALIAWLLLRGGDDDEASATSSRLIVEIRDDAGQPVDRGIIVNVTGPAGSESDFVWLRPPGTADGPSAGGSTGTDGRIDFEWEVDEAVVTDLTSWTATVSLVETIPAGWSAPGPDVDCILERPDADATVVAMAVALDGNDPAVDRVASYTFPNYEFRLGDAVTCALISSPPTTVDTTTVETTIVDTTVPPETTSATTEPETTTTTAPVPPPTITVPPQPAATLWDVITTNPDLSGIMAWIVDAGLEDQFADPDATLTLLAPSNQAIENARILHGPPAGPIDFDDTANLLLLVNTHLVETGVLSIADIAELAELEVVEPGPHDVDDSTDPPTIGGALILVGDVNASNGVIHVIDTVLLPVALTP